jgi:Tol biopolymer transport system component/tRNA A-37 threonylcarbamoyl transferase component Bud32
MSSLPARVSGALSAQYRIEQEIGAGGMATVYLADDLRHSRRVALKVLRPELAAVIGAERFLAEIRLTANLQHPHILPLFDSGEADSFLYYVMPFVEGESLRDRIRREKQLPIEDAVRIAREVADALDYAHRHGVIHRDIKPENILLHDGRALVADFGIALAASQAGTRMTETGMSLGTPHYMSPEQAMGEREITARSDVYALGAVLYEILTGDPPFTGSTAQAIVARVVTEQPRPLLPQRHTIPEHVEAAVLRALEKLPADRFAGAAQFAAALEERTGARAPARTEARTAAGPAVVARPRWKDPLTLGLAAVALAVVAVALARGRRPAPEPPPVVRFLFSGSDSAPASNTGGPWPAAVSADGSLLVYEVILGATTSLYLRRSDQLEGRPLPGTVGATQPLFSPDGRWVEFEAAGAAKKVRLDGTSPVVIARGIANNGADWTSQDELVVGATATSHGLSRVSVTGGELTPFTVPDTTRGDIEHVWPIGLPDGRAVAFAIWTGTLETSELAIAELDGGKVTRLGLKGIRPLAVVDGALVYVLADGVVMAVPLDLGHRKLAGRPMPVLDPVQVSPGLNGNSAVFVSRGGALVSGSQGALARLTWLGRDGVTRPIGREVREFGGPRLSPDGRQIAVVTADGAKRDVWIYDLETGTFSRLTGNGTAGTVAWNRDGSEVVYTALAGGLKWGVYAQSVGNATDPRTLLELPSLSPAAAPAPDGRSLLVQSIVRTSWDVQVVTLDSARAVRPFHASPGTDADPQISPDGRWASVSSNESGTFEVYVRSYPEPTVKVQVSVGGAFGSDWSGDGSRLYYSSGSAIVEARLATTPGLRVLSRDTVFRRIPNNAGWSVTGDGSRLLLSAQQSTAYPLTVVPGWWAELREKLGATR